MSIETEITMTTVWELSEVEVFNYLLRMENENPSEQKSKAIKCIESAFDFRTISKKRKDIYQELKMKGYLFFERDDSPMKYSGICKRTPINDDSAH